MDSSGELHGSMSSTVTSFSAESASSVLAQSGSRSRMPGLESVSQTLYGQLPSPSASLQLKLETITIRISGLRNKINPKTYGNPTFSQVLCVPSDTLIGELGNYLLKEQPGKSTQQINLINN